MPDISVMVEGGKATAGAPLGPALGPTGVNIGLVVSQINEKTKNFAGTKVPVKVIVSPKDKSFEIEVGSPPMSALIKKELGLEKGAGNPKTEALGSLSVEQVKKVALMKMESINSYNLFSAAREVVGTANSMGVQVEGMHAKEFQKVFESGKYDDFFEKEPLEKSVKKEAKTFVKGLEQAAGELVQESHAIKKEIEAAAQGVAKDLGLLKNAKKSK